MNKTFGMISDYRRIDRQQDWLWKQTPEAFGVWGQVQIVAPQSQPDFLLLYNYNFKRHQKISPWWQPWRNDQLKIDSSLFRGVSKKKIVYLWREPPLEETIATVKANYEIASQYCGYVSGPDNYAPIPEYMPAIWYVNVSFRELDQMNPPQKVKLCSWITSGIDRTAKHRQRLAFLRQLQEQNVNFDLYGRRLPQWAKGYGAVENKWHCMSPYYYNLAIENYAENDLYVSEKLWDALLSWCLPIYWGGPAADRLLPPGSFLRLPSLDEQGIAYIREVTASPDAWYAAKEKIAEARQIILHKLNLLNWMDEYVKKI